MSVLELLFDFFFGIGNFFIDILPEIKLPQSFTDVTGFIISWGVQLSWVFPFKTLIEIAIISFTLFFASLVLEIVKFLIQFVPFLRNSTKF